MTSVDHDPVNHPAHYTQRGVECIEITRHCSFNLGNAIKYIWRAGDKGDAVQDLRKAIFYLRDERARYAVAGTWATCPPPSGIDPYAIAGTFTSSLGKAFHCLWRVAFGRSGQMLHNLDKAIQHIEDAIVWLGQPKSEV